MASIDQICQQLIPLHLQGLLSRGNEIIHVFGIYKHSMKCPPLSVIIIITAITKSLTDLSFFYTQEVFFSSQSSSTTASQVCLNECCSPVLAMWHKWIKWYQGQREVGEGLEKKVGEVELFTYTLTEKPTLSLYTPLGIYLPDRNWFSLH